MIVTEEFINKIKSAKTAADLDEPIKKLGEIYNMLRDYQMKRQLDEIDKITKHMIEENER